MDVRHATAEDLSSLILIQREVQQLHAAELPEVYRKPVDDELRSAMRTLFGQADTSVFIAIEGDVPLGFAVVILEDRPENPFRFAARVAHVEQFGVLGSARRKGVGRALLAAVYDFAQNERCEKVELDALAFNEHAQRFYLAEGFETFRHRMVRHLSVQRANAVVVPVDG